MKYQKKKDEEKSLSIDVSGGSTTSKKTSRPSQTRKSNLKEKFTVQNYPIICSDYT